MKIVVGLFDKFEDARDAVKHLTDSGFARENISMIANDTSGEFKRYVESQKQGEDLSQGAGWGAVLGGIAGLLVGLGVLMIPGVGPILAAGPIVSGLVGAGVGAAAGGLLGALVDAGIPDEQAEVYAEGVRRGGTLVSIHTPDERAQEAVNILNRHNPVDIQQRSQSWRQSGWKGYDASAQPYTSDQITTERNLYTGSMSDTGRDRDRFTDKEVDVPIVEENLQVGKRQDVDKVRVHTYVTETPVEKKVNLRDERVEVERRPTDRPISGGEDAFKERTYEFDETHEEPMVKKEARVVEEVHIRKDVEEHDETIHDTLRRTEVDVERTSGDDFDEFEPMFRNHYSGAYSMSGYTYDDYAPAYRYGYTLANTSRYQNRRWEEIERDARRDWERQHPDSAWENFKDAVRHAWNEVTGR